MHGQTKNKLNKWTSWTKIEWDLKKKNENDLFSRILENHWKAARFKREVLEVVLGEGHVPETWLLPPDLMKEAHLAKMWILWVGNKESPLSSR